MFGFWHPGNFNGSGFLGSGGEGAVYPTTDWRIPIASSYDSAGDSAITTALTASDTAKTLPNFSVGASTTRSVALSLGAISGPGGMIYYNLSGSANNASLTITVTESFDSTNGTDGNWQAVSHTPAKPSGDASSTGLNSRGQVIELDSGAARWVKVQFQNADASNAVTVYMGAFQFQATDAENDFLLVAGMSITGQSCDVIQLRNQAIAAIPGRDPLFINWGRSGAKAGDIYTENVVGGLTAYPRVAAVLMDPGPNDVLNTARAAGKVYSTDNTTCPTDIENGIQDSIDYAAGLNKPIFVSGINFGNYATDYPVDTTPDVPGVNMATTAAQENGSKPYNENVVYPLIESANSVAWDSALDIPRGDGYSRFLYIWDSGLTSDGVHGNTYGSQIYRGWVVDIWQYICTGVWPTSYVESLIEAAEPNTSAANKTRIQLVFDALPSTTTATAARTALQDRIDAITTGYSDPSLTGSAKLPNDASITSGTLKAWFDFANYDKIYSDNGTTGITNGVGVYRADDRANGTPWQLTQTTSTNRPLWQAGVLNGLGGLLFDGSNDLMVGDANLQALMNGSGSAKSFTLFIVRSLTSLAGASGMDVMGISNGATNYLICAVQASSANPRYFIGDGTGGAFAVSPSDSSAISTPYAISLTFDGSTTTNNVNYRRDGGTATTGSSAKTAAVTGNIFALGRRGSGGTAFFAGYIHELIWFDQVLSTAHRQAVEEYLRQKWGTA